MDDLLHVGLIGFGMAGKTFHAPFLSSLEGFHLAMIRTTKKEDIEIARQKYPLSEIVSNSEELFLNPKISLIVIATPNHTHFSLAKQALLAGKHVVIDKPFTTSYDEAQELIKIAKAQSKILSVYQNRRWDSDFLTVKKVIESKVLGPLTYFEAHFDRFRNIVKKDAWKEDDLPGSGILYDLGSHLIDQALDLFGQPEELFADIRIQRSNAKVPDYFELNFYYPSFKARLTAGMLVRSPAVKYLVSGQQGNFVKYGMDVQEDALKTGATPMTSAGWGEEPSSLWGTLNVDFNNMHFIGQIESEKGDYKQYYRNINHVLRGKAPLIVTATQAKATIKIMELAIISHREKKVLSIPNDLLKA